MAMLAVFSVMPYELNTRTPEISLKRRWTETGIEGHRIVTVSIGKHRTSPDEEHCGPCTTYRSCVG